MWHVAGVFRGGGVQEEKYGPWRRAGVFFRRFGMGAGANRWLVKRGVGLSVGNRPAVRF